MKKFKVGQTVYYYLDRCGLGEIVTCRIKQATKDLATGKITYVVSCDGSYAWFSDRSLTADYLYSSRKQIFKEHKDELAYGALNGKLDALDVAIQKIFNEYMDKIQANPASWLTLSTSLDNQSIIVDGIGDIREEFNKLKKEVADLKKKIKKPTKKTVKKEESAA